ncbi:MAG: hypothetical protein RIB67_10295 [Miltoncostaeaceae bacterium]
MSDEQENGGRGRIGHEIFDQVERLVADGGMSRTQAFQQISDETGRRAGTVAANYYRVARQRGATLQPRTPRGARRSAGGGGAAATAALSKAQEALTELGSVIEQQQGEIAELRERAEAFDKARALFASQD